ncbi:MAG: hypothetical protein WBA23_04835, partial [Tunicatimonas sp.]
KKRFLRYADYQSKTVEDIFSPQQREGAIKHDAYVLESSVFYNHGGHFSRKSLPTEVQLSPVQTIKVQDMNNDGQLDLLLGGNFRGAKPEVGQYNASYGALLVNQGENWKVVSASESGLSVEGEVRHWALLPRTEDTLWVAVKNNGPLGIFKKESQNTLLNK